MLVTAPRQPALHPQTIRTRLARFTPGRGGGWTTSWSCQTHRRADISAADEFEARVADHLGCYGAALSHALAQAGVAPERLRVTAQPTVQPEAGTQMLTVEVRAQALGIDQPVLAAIARRVEPTCAVWNELVADMPIRLIAVVSGSDEPDSASEGTTRRQVPSLQSLPRARMAASRPARLSWLQRLIQEVTGDR
jgi:hypothetical protein